MRYLIGSFDAPVEDIIEAVERDKDKILFFDVFSPGGNCANGLALLGMIQQARRKGKKIITRNRGIAFSEGARLLVQGNPIYLVDTAVTMFHEASTQYGFSIEEFYGWLTEKYETLFKKRKDFLDILNHDMAGFEPIERLLKQFGEKKFKGDYYLLPHDMLKLLGDQVKIEDIPDELLALETWKEPKDDMDGLLSLSPMAKEAPQEAAAEELAEDLEMLDEADFLIMHDLVNKEMERRKALVLEAIDKMDK